ncbi:MAG: hypothetical protein HDQ88_11860 [Clostridia bacterium]|nr:hypothetical protein [Clostridia bacterium]
MNLRNAVRNWKQRHKEKKQSKDFYGMCDKYADTMSKKYGIEVYYDKDAYGSVFTRNQNKKAILIGMKDVERFGFSGTSYDEINFERTAIEMAKSFRHAQQDQAIRQPTDDPRIVEMAKSEILRQTIPEFYQADYYNNPMELDAMHYAMKIVREKKDDVAPRTDTDAFQRDFFNNGLTTHKDTEWYVDGPVRTPQDAMATIQRKINHPEQAPAHHDLTATLRTYSPMFQDFMQDKKRMSKLNTCRTAQEQKDLLLSFVYERQPELFTEYQSLNQWTPRPMAKMPTMEEIKTREQNFSRPQGQHGTSYDVG